MLEQLVRAIGKASWEDTLNTGMKFYKESIIFYSVFTSFLIAAGVFFLYAFYSLLLASGLSQASAALGTGGLSLVVAGSLFLAWTTAGNKVRISTARSLMDELLISFLEGLQIEDPEELLKNRKSKEEKNKNIVSAIPTIAEMKRFKNK